MIEPKIRFNNNSWQKHKVGELCDLLTGYPFPGDKILNRGKNLLMRGINITEGRIRHSDEIDRYYNEDTIGLEKYRLQVGDLVIGMDGSKVGKNSALVTSKENYSLLVQRVARLRNEDKNLINLIQIAVGSDKFIKYVEEMKTSSAIPHISPADIRNFPLSLPEDSNERRLVASYFTSLDSQISASTSRLASLKQMKAASLQAMFPQEGENVPKIRFKGFEGEWNISRLGDFSTSFSGGTPTAGVAEFYGGEIPFIRSGEIHENRTELFLTEAGINNSSAKVVEKGTLLYALYGATSGEVGISKIKGAINQAILAIYPNKSVNKIFLSNYLQLKKQRIVGEFLQGGQGNLSGALVKSILVTYPSLEEQQAIASYFTSLDRQISLQSQRLEKLKQIKSACLDKMFV